MVAGDIATDVASELAKIGLTDIVEVIHGTVVRVCKAYPAYFGANGEK